MTRTSSTGAFLCILFACLVFTAVSHGDDPAEEARKDEAIKKHRQQFEGKWRVTAVTADGKPGKEEDIRKLLMTYNADGEWTLEHDGKEISKGSSLLDPTLDPPTIDLTVTEGAALDQQFLGIYEVAEKKQTLCLAPSAKSRPIEFESVIDGGSILMELTRE